MGKAVPLAEFRSYLGQEVGLSDWFTVSADKIKAFAELTEDRQWIHVNEDLAKQGPYGTIISHGYFVLSLISFFNYQNRVFPGGIKWAVNYGLNRVRFITPVKAGSRVRNRVVLKGLEDKGEGRVLVVSENTVEIEGQNKPAMVAESLAMLFL